MPRKAKTLPTSQTRAVAKEVATTKRAIGLNRANPNVRSGLKRTTPLNPYGGPKPRYFQAGDGNGFNFGGTVEGSRGAMTQNRQRRVDSANAANPNVKQAFKRTKR